jgi:hypothetical protein
MTHERVRRRFSCRAARSCRAPSIGLSKDPPLHRHHDRSPLPLTRGCASVPRCYTLHMGRLRGSSPPWRFTPPVATRACCIPQPTMRFTGFSFFSAPSADCGMRTSSPMLTLQSLPLSSSIHRVTAVCCSPSSFPGCDTGSTSRLCSTRESVASCTPFPVLTRPLLSWASHFWSSHTRRLSGTSAWRDLSLRIPRPRGPLTRGVPWQPFSARTRFPPRPRRS